MSHTLTLYLCVTHTECICVTHIDICVTHAHNNFCSTVSPYISMSLTFTIHLFISFIVHPYTTHIHISLYHIKPCDTHIDSKSLYHTHFTVHHTYSSYSPTAHTFTVNLGITHIHRTSLSISHTFTINRYTTHIQQTSVYHTRSAFISTSH